MSDEHEGGLPAWFVWMTVVSAALLFWLLLILILGLLG